MYHSIDKFNKRADEIDSTITQEATVKKIEYKKSLSFYSCKAMDVQRESNHKGTY